VWKLHGLPESIISDRGVQFAVEMMKEVNNLLGIQTKLSMAYYPQTDVSQTSFGHISTKSSTIPTVLKPA